ncbi:shikimate kinase [Robiginitalea sp. IMCC44478]|uniref:shikimate kinase n=1 Tax=Robiginitalea sp. IMCC44478 TaxID=3459122 RepID=UPI0040429BE0
MIIVLIGYMGSGKSTVGRALAESMGFRFLDLDTYIEERMEKSIPELFEDKGQIYFRKKEHELLKEVLENHDQLVLALGGGAPCYAGNMDLVLSHTSHVFYLMLSVSQLAARLQYESGKRPLISHLKPEELPDFIGKHLFERVKYYNMAPHHIAVQEKGIEQLVEEIHRKSI